MYEESNESFEFIEKIPEINIKSKKISSLTFKEIKKIILWTKGKAVKPSYIGIAYKERLESINIIVFTDNFSKNTSKDPKNTYLNTLKHQIQSLFNFKYCYSIHNNFMIDLEDIKTFLLKETRSFLYEIDHEVKISKKKHTKAKDSSEIQEKDVECKDDKKIIECTNEEAELKSQDYIVSKQNYFTSKENNCENQESFKKSFLNKENINLTKDDIESNHKNITPENSINKRSEASGYVPQETSIPKTKKFCHNKDQSNNDNEKKGNFFKANLSVLTEDNIKPFIFPNFRLLFQESNTFIRSYISISDQENTFQNFKPLKYKKGNKKYFLLAIDCEMMKSGEKSVLGRISMLDHLGNIIYDKYVTPDPNEIITDYVTKYSGLSKEVFENSNNCVDKKQLWADLEDIIGEDTVLLGHSISNDLSAMEIIHEKLIDTSFIYKLRNNFRISLKSLANKYFNQNIQHEEHCSIEDSRACLDLLAIKVEEMIELRNGKKYLDFGYKINEFKNADNFKDQMKNKCINFYECSLDELKMSGFKNEYKRCFSFAFFKYNNKIYFLM